MPFRFLDLPAELRDIIYELCLVKGTIHLVPRPRNDHRYDLLGSPEKPEWALLGVNRQVRGEAASTILSKNHFVLGYDTSSERILWYRWKSSSLDNDFSLAALAKRKLQSISIQTDLRGLFKQDSLDLAEYGCTLYEKKYVAGERTPWAHANVDELPIMWSSMCSFYKKVKFLQIDITNAFCPLGCCRYFAEAARAIGCAARNNRKLETIEVFGTKNGRERAVVTEKIKIQLQSADYGTNYRFVLRFKASVCNEKCLNLHYYDLDEELGDEEMHANDILRWKKESSCNNGTG